MKCSNKVTVIKPGFDTQRWSRTPAGGHGGTGQHQGHNCRYQTPLMQQPDSSRWSTAAFMTRVWETRVGKQSCVGCLHQSGRFGIWSCRLTVGGTQSQRWGEMNLPLFVAKQVRKHKRRRELPPVKTHTTMETENTNTWTQSAKKSVLISNVCFYCSIATIQSGCLPAGPVNTLKNRSDVNIGKETKPL